MKVFKQLKNGLKAVESTRELYEIAISNVDFILNDICEFNAQLQFLPGDNHLVLNADTTNVASLDCLDGKDRNNKLTAEEHDKASI